MAERRGPQAPATSNVYTVLCLIALLMLIAGIIFVVMRSQELFGQSNPWKLVEVSAGWLTAFVPA